MAFHPLTLVSIFAYALFCALAAAIGAKLGRNSPGRIFAGSECAPEGLGEVDCNAVSRAKSDSITKKRRHKERLKDICVIFSGLAALAAFMCIPLGALPALVPVSWSGALAVAFLAVSAAFSPAGKWAAVFGLALALGVAAMYARQRGVPGDLLSLETYAGMPLAGVMEWPGRAALLAGGLVALFLIGRAGEDEERGMFLRAWAVKARRLACLAVWVCIFMPAGLATEFDMPVVAGLALDAVYFWGKVAVLDYFTSAVSKII